MVAHYIAKRSYFLVEIIESKKSRQEISPDDFLALCQTYPKVHIDFGTGDGMFALRRARKVEDELVIGLDADRDSLVTGATKAAKKPAKGGAANVRYVCANAIELPDDFAQPVADTFSINFPWGSLLDVTVLADEDFLSGIKKCLKDKAIGDIYVNLFALQDSETLRTNHLPEITAETLESHVKPLWEKAGFKWLEHQFFASGEKVDVASTWASRLTKGSGRATVYWKVEVL